MSTVYYRSVTQEEEKYQSLYKANVKKLFINAHRFIIDT